MNISWKGGSSIGLKRGKATLLVNPDKTAKLDEANVVMFDKTDKKNPQLKDGMMIDWPGEYDVSGFSCKGIEVHEKEGSRIIYTFNFPEGKVAWLGEISENLSEEVIEKLGEVHVLMVPVGDKGVLNAKEAFKLVEELEPMVVIPICYGGEREGLPAFLKEMDVKHPEAQKSFDLKKSALNMENMELVILEA